MAPRRYAHHRRNIGALMDSRATVEFQETPRGYVWLWTLSQNANMWEQ